MNDLLFQVYYIISLNNFQFSNRFFLHNILYAESQNPHRSLFPKSIFSALFLLCEHIFHHFLRGLFLLSRNINSVGFC
ncbi:hypothetical protein HOLDEFILI_01660 [Holdemania filiformis DSM 12042]|uniref:Uncharacterized protein n=1 Tax=Holdemania filiformis DSM 12042 TaxID=545696 RepID=B9Y766_9FIRM|nr:hypothetical protein HOLDEFILI_01660 [Holdemania filiformis DSM 12042]